MHISYQSKDDYVLAPFYTLALLGLLTDKAVVFDTPPCVDPVIRSTALPPQLDVTGVDGVRSSMSW